MTEPVDTQNASQDAAQSGASVSPVPAAPTVVDAPPSAAAPGADIIGHSEQPLPGARSSVAADPHSEPSSLVGGEITETGDGPDWGQNDFCDAADEFSDAHPSKQPVALRPTPAGPTSQQPARVQRAREENR